MLTTESVPKRLPSYVCNCLRGGERVSGTTANGVLTHYAPNSILQIASHLRLHRACSGCRRQRSLARTEGGGRREGGGDSNEMVPLQRVRLFLAGSPVKSPRPAERRRSNVASGPSSQATRRLRRISLTSPVHHLFESRPNAPLPAHPPPPPPPPQR